MQRTVSYPVLSAAVLASALLAACATGPAPQAAAPPASAPEASAAEAAPTSPAPAAEASPLPYLERLPPLVDRDLFFGDPEISGSQLSPDGEYLTFIKPYEGVRNIWIKGLDEPFEAARPLSADERPVPGYFWSEDGEYVLYVQDKGGNENFHIYAVDPTTDAEEATGVPPARDLTPLEGIRAYIYAVPEVAPEIAEKLESLTVDVASVEMPEPASGLDAAKTAPLPLVDASRLALGAVTYSSRFTAQGQEIEMSAVRTIERSDEDGASVLEVSDAVEGPMGGQDHYVLQADSLRPVSRQTQQGPATIEIDYGAKEVTGNLTVQGRENPIQVTLEAPVFGDSSALDTAITALPLAEGYRTTVRSVEIGMQQRVRFWSVAVEATEMVEVPAGTFETFRVTVEPLDGEPGGNTLWIAEETPRRVVKAESELPPQMGGGTAVTELVSIE